jgi:hypothetical protein
MHGAGGLAWMPTDGQRGCLGCSTPAGCSGADLLIVSENSNFAMIAPLFATAAHQRAYVHTPNKKVRTASVCAACLGTPRAAAPLAQPPMQPPCTMVERGEGSGCKDEVLARLKYAMQSANRGIMPCKAQIVASCRAKRKSWHHAVRSAPARTAPARAEGLRICARDMR